MKGLLTPAILAVAALLLGVTVVLTCAKSPTTTGAVPIGHTFFFQKSFLPMDLGHPPILPPPLRLEPDRLISPPAIPLNPGSISTPSKPRLPLLAQRSEHESLPPGVDQNYP